MPRSLPARRRRSLRGKAFLDGSCEKRRASFFVNSLSPTKLAPLLVVGEVLADARARASHSRQTVGGRPSGAVCGRPGRHGLSLGAERALAAWPGDAATSPGALPRRPRAGMMVQGVRRREVLRRTLSLEMLERMGRELLARWRAVLLSLHRDRERLRRFVRAVQAQILISPSIL